LAAHDARERKLRQTKAAARAAAAQDDMDLDLLDDNENADPELSKVLAMRRKDCRATHNSKRALKVSPRHVVG